MPKKKKEVPKVPVPRRFYLDRKVDASGVSGTGMVATGVVFPTGKAVIEWIVGDHPSIETHDTLEDCMAVHGHGVNTQVVWVDNLPMYIEKR